MQMVIVWLKQLYETREMFLVKLIKFTIILGVFLLPLFFIPLSAGFIEYSKVVLFYALVIICSFFWLIKFLLTRKINITLKFLDVLLVLFLITYLISSLLSVDRQLSLIGMNLQISSSFISVLFLFIFYFFVSRFIVTVKDFKYLTWTLLASICLLALTNLINVLPLNFSFNFLGISVNTFSLLLIVGVYLSGGLFLLSTKFPYRIANLIIALALLTFLFFLDIQQGLLVFAVSIFIFIVLLSFKSAYFSNKLVVGLTFLLFITVIILVLPVSNWTKVIIPQEFSLPASFSWQITKSTLAQNFLFGVGPQNFSYSYYLYKPLAINQTSLWQLGFRQGSSYWLDLLNNIGVLSFALVVAIAIKYFLQFFSYIRRMNLSENKIYKRFLAMALSVTVLFVFFVWGMFNNFSFTQSFLLILFLGLSVSFLSERKKQELAINKTWASIISYLLLIFVLSFTYYASKHIIADYYAEKLSVGTFNQTEDFTDIDNRLADIKKLNPSYFGSDLLLLNLMVQKYKHMVNFDPEADMSELIQQIDKLVVSTAKINTKQADYYYSLQHLISELKFLGFSTYETENMVNQNLLQLDPNNPELYIDRSLLVFNQYLFAKQNGENLDLDSLLKSVKNDLDKSIELKNDYVLGYYNRGLYYEEIGDQDQALSNIEKAYQLDPNEKIIVLSLKKLYLNQDKVEQAVTILNNYLQENPDDEEIKQAIQDIK